MKVTEKDIRILLHACQQQRDELTHNIEEIDARVIELRKLLGKPKSTQIRDCIYMVLESSDKPLRAREIASQVHSKFYETEAIQWVTQRIYSVLNGNKETFIGVMKWKVKRYSIKSKNV